MNVYRKDIRMGEGYDEIKRSAVQILTSTCQNKDMFIFSRPMSDTVYRITDKALEPLFILKKGKYDTGNEDHEVPDVDPDLFPAGVLPDRL